MLSRFSSSPPTQAVAASGKSRPHGPGPKHPARCLDVHGLAAALSDCFVYLIYFQAEENLKTSICTFLSVLSHLDIITENIPEKVGLYCL